MSNRLDTRTEVHEFEDYQDVVMRVHSTRGSSPVVIVSEGAVQSAESIGQRVLELFGYVLESAVYEAAAVTA
jgi:hypothetical protein